MLHSFATSTKREEVNNMYALQRKIRGNSVFVTDDDRVLYVSLYKRRYIPFIYKNRSQEYRAFNGTAKYLSEAVKSGKIILVDATIAEGLPLEDANMVDWYGCDAKTDRIRFYAVLPNLSSCEW